MNGTAPRLLAIASLICAFLPAPALAAWQDDFLPPELRQELADFGKFAGMARVWRVSTSFIGRPIELKGSLPPDAKPDAIARLDFPTPVMPVLGLPGAKSQVAFEDYEVRRYGDLLLAFPLTDGKTAATPCAVGLDASGTASRKLDALYVAMSRGDGGANARKLAKELVAAFPSDMDLWHRLSRVEEGRKDKTAAIESARMALSRSQALNSSLGKREASEQANIRASMLVLYWTTALASRVEALAASSISQPEVLPTPEKRTVAETPQANTEPNVTPLPAYKDELIGRNEVRVRNPNDFAVAAGIRATAGGKNMTVPANGVRSVYIPDGKYDIYFVYSDRPNALFQGDGFTLNGNGVEIQIVKAVNGNYGIRQVK
jgi:hypothetical protein